MPSDGVRVTVLLFAQLREAAASGECEISLPAGGRGADARAALARRFPALADMLPGVRLAVNESYASWDAEIKEGDTLALVPPVSGG